jgi:hypothetical protein
MKPATIIHCDWSVDASKRWRATARMLADSSYAVEDPAPVGAVETLFLRVCAETPAGPILAGFDFPIGVPRQYSARAGITRFPDALLGFGLNEWAFFYEVAETANQISLTRPFYPRRPGGTKKQHLTDGLGLGSALELLRQCDHATPARRKACELFWTLGPNQVGRAAITGWRDLLAPALRKRQIVIWPFDGDLRILLESARITVAETYPAEIYGQLGLAYGFGKRRPEGRKSQACSILSWCNQNCVSLAPKLAADIADGFGEKKEVRQKKSWVASGSGSLPSEW